MPKRLSQRAVGRAVSAAATLKALGIKATNPGVFDGAWSGSGELLQSISPNNGQVLASVRTATPGEYERALERATLAFQYWLWLPAPNRG